jgi:hypothetical protein
MAEHVQVPCPGCGFDRTLARLSLKSDGTYSESPWALEQRVRVYGGRGKLTCEHRDLPLPIAIGLRAMLQARLDQIDAELAAAGVVL